MFCCGNLQPPLHSDTLRQLIPLAWPREGRKRWRCWRVLMVFPKCWIISVYTAGTGSWFFGLYFKLIGTLPFLLLFFFFLLTKDSCCVPRSHPSPPPTSPGSFPSRPSLLVSLLLLLPQWPPPLEGWHSTATSAQPMLRWLRGEGRWWWGMVMWPFLSDLCQHSCVSLM